MRPIPSWLAQRVDVAAEVFAELGFEGTRVEDLTEATGVPSSTLYYYFAGKEALLAFLLQRWLDRVADAVAETVTGEGTAAARLDRVVRTQLGLMASGGAVCRVLLAELGRIGRLPDIAKAMNHAFHHPVERLLEEGARDGSLRRVSVETTAAAIFGASTIAGLHYLVAGKVLDVEDVAEAVTGLVHEGIGVAQSRARRRTTRRAEQGDVR